jgi:hypothetical protein
VTGKLRVTEVPGLHQLAGEINGGLFVKHRYLPAVVSKSAYSVPLLAGSWLWLKLMIKC